MNLLWTDVYQSGFNLTFGLSDVQNNYDSVFSLSGYVFTITSNYLFFFINYLTYDSRNSLSLFNSSMRNLSS